jgi:hypothetical protein
MVHNFSFKLIRVFSFRILAWHYSLVLIVVVASILECYLFRYGRRVLEALHFTTEMSLYDDFASFVCLPAEGPCRLLLAALPRDLVAFS